ncbi:MAG: stage III sporulation protein AB [Oscillospiraceae bacterium]|nr:stage III sporulation protein AB [Oscillospiraceae bacterium]
MRLMGGLLIVSAFSFCGVSFAGEAKTEIRALEALLSLLRTLSQRLSWGKEPLHTLFSSMDDPYLERIGFLPLLRNAEGRNYPDAWERALRLLPLPPEAMREAQALGASLGRVSLEAQLERLSLCIASIETCRENAQDNARRKCRSTVALWVLAGLLAALLLI